jgi:hypothetical protein
MTGCGHHQTLVVASSQQSFSVAIDPLLTLARTLPVSAAQGQADKAVEDQTIKTDGAH